MKHLFATRPTNQFDNYTAVHIGAGKRYHNRFVNMPGRALMWELEQVVLKEIITSLKPRTVLDFACGTGRISSFVERTFTDAAIDGIDISESMLDIARQNATRTHYGVMTSSEAVTAYGEGHFDLVLAFRFFANAEPDLRLNVGADLTRLVSDNGAIVVNNHRNFWSTSYVGRRLVGQKPAGALNTDIERIFVERGCRVTRKLSLGVWPQADTKALLLPWSAVRVVERRNLAWLAARHSLGYNTIWVLSKSPSARTQT